MSNAHDILNSIHSKDYFNAKNFINEALMSKMANALEEKLVHFAPTLFEAKKAKKDYDKDGNVEMKFLSVFKLLSIIGISFLNS